MCTKFGAMVPYLHLPIVYHLHKSTPYLQLTVFALTVLEQHYRI